MNDEEHDLLERLSGQTCKNCILRDAVVFQLERLPKDTLKVLYLLTESFDVSIVGGAVRDWYVNAPNSPNFAVVSPKDLDLVLDTNPRDLFEKLLREGAEGILYHWVLNSFNGYRFSNLTLPVDVWSLPETWAFQELKFQNPTMSDLISTVFLNIDAIAFRIRDGEVFENGFFDALDQRKLEIVYEKNPYPEHCIARTLSMAKKYNFVLGSSVKSYIDVQLRSGITREQVVNVSMKKYNGRGLELL